jgi:hypothetical protein
MQKTNFKENLTFHFGLPNDNENSEEFSRSFNKSLGLKTFSGCWAEIDLNSPQINEFLIEVNKQREVRNAEFIGFCHLTQSLPEDKEYEWYEVKSESSLWEYIDFYKYDNIDMENVKAYKIDPTADVANGGFYNSYVSERFKALVENEGFTGLNFLWIKDIGKYEAKQWYTPVALSPIGKGIDHPWFDTSTLIGSDSWQPLNEPFRTGVYHFNNKQIKNEIKIENEITRKIIDLFEKVELTIVSTRKYLKQFLPNSDFAFYWNQEDVIKNGITRKQRGLCINNRVKKRLLEKRILTSSEFQPLHIVENFDNIEILDSSGEYPEPLYSMGQIEKVRDYLSNEFAKFCKRERPKYAVKFKEALKHLKKAKKKRDGDFQKGLKINDLTVPEVYREVLKITNGGILDLEVTIHAYNDLKPFGDEIKGILERYGDIKEKYFHFGFSPSGDWFSLNISQSSDDYLTVVRFSHETNDIIHKWKNIAFFISDVLTGFYE